LKKLRLLTNNPKKVAGIEGYGLEIVESVPVKAAPNAHNRRYLETKKRKMGHIFSDTDFPPEGVEYKDEG
jgi:3,4-dihydroxy 2-butanone 4-phosphate synthase / GTP cyclohydrolase II